MGRRAVWSCGVMQIAWGAFVGCPTIWSMHRANCHLAEATLHLVFKLNRKRRDIVGRLLTARTPQKLQTPRFNSRTRPPLIETFVNLRK